MIKVNDSINKLIENITVRDEEGNNPLGFNEDKHRLVGVFVDRPGEEAKKKPKPDYSDEEKALFKSKKIEKY